MPKINTNPVTISREYELRMGQREMHAGIFVLYWEPYADNDEYRQGYTIDRRKSGHGPHRWRCGTLEEADALIEALKRKYALEIAKVAFGIGR